jgi:linoleoyl-CoA desaturase
MERRAKPTYDRNGDEVIFTQLRTEVKKTVSLLEGNRHKTIILKAAILPILYFGIYTLALLFGKRALIYYACYFAMGLLLVSIFLNIIHDAVHGTIFKNEKMNAAYVYLFDLMGANSFIWKLRHIRFHHNYPNVNGWDTDIEQSSLARIFPTGEFSRMHRYQHIYLPFLYPLYLANWLLIRDFKDFFNKKKTVRKLIDIPRIEYVKLFLFKGDFLFYLIILPKFLLGLSWSIVIIAFAIMLFTASITSLMVLLSPHANIESSFPMPNEDNKFEHSWMMHMLMTTNDITHDNWFTRFFMGCFNYHVVHHLFPDVNHAYYPEITSLLQQKAKKYDLPYRQYSLLTSLRNHYRLLKNNRLVENIFEETM